MRTLEVVWYIRGHHGYICGYLRYLRESVYHGMIIHMVNILSTSGNVQYTRRMS